MIIPDQATIERPSVDDASPDDEQAFSVQDHPISPQTQSLHPSSAGRVSPTTQVGSGSGSGSGSTSTS